MNKSFIIILFIICLLPTISFAADISFYSDKNIFIQNEDFLVNIFLDTKSVMVNAVEGTVTFPSDLLELKEIRDGNSSINFWVEKPHNAGDGKIVFSGITAGGFSGQKIFLFGLVLGTQKIGSSSIGFDNIQVLKNDGLGTKIFTTGVPLSFSISGETNNFVPENLRVEDTNPPENFYPFIGSDPAMFNGKYFLVFSTVDKGIGVDHYETRESPWFFPGDWGGQYINTESPYLLKDQTLKSLIYIKAIDKAGNERIVKLGAQNKPTGLKQNLIFVIILVVCIFSYLFYRKKIWQKSNQ